MKKVLVTGGTGGIGVGVAHCLAEVGCSVIAVSASQAELDAFKPQDSIELRLMDVTDQASVNAVFASLDGLDGLVNCAGILRRGDEYDIDVFQRVIDVNLVGTTRCWQTARAALSIWRQCSARSVAPLYLHILRQKAVFRS
jgi:NAD(P)-dependent dehydrogenase (short-subunit alcohol dehydrogenase family)